MAADKDTTTDLNTYFLPEYGFSVEAKDYESALKLADKKAKENA